MKTIPPGTDSHTYYVGLEINERHKYMKRLREYKLQGKARQKPAHSMPAHKTKHSTLGCAHTCLKMTQSSTLNVTVVIVSCA